MKKHLLFLLMATITCTAVYAQNLVPNYSFEQADSCPTNFNDRTYRYSLGCVGWGEANNNTTDYYNACDTTIPVGHSVPIVGIPENGIGFQYAYEGVAYAGIVMYDSGAAFYKEYLITDIPDLEIDTAYKVTIEVSLADSSRFATNAMGVLFTTYGSPNQFNDLTINVTPQIDYTSYGVISDTAHWTTLSGTFVADSEYSSLIIGGFKNASDMTISTVNENSMKNGTYFSCYYIDNVVVEKLSSTGISSATSADIATHLYPNPFTDHATLAFNNVSSQNCSLTIYNVQGIVVQHIDNIISDRIRIERNGLPAGFYYYQLHNGNDGVENGKFIIK